MTPWSKRGGIDFGVLERNCATLARVSHGIYTTGADGEFYALELNEFRTLARGFAKAMRALGVDAAMGVGWTHTQGIIDRIRIACDCGIPNVHVCFPTFMPLTAADAERFWDDLAKGESRARWIHYAYPRCLPVLTGKHYARLAARHPQLIGTKLSNQNWIELTEIFLNGQGLAHLATDWILPVAAMLGCRGVCSYWSNVLPKWHRAYWDAVEQKDWDEVMRRHRQLMAWELSRIKPLADAGHRHGVVGKTQAALSGLLEESRRMRLPYQPIEDRVVSKLAREFRREWAAELKEEG